MARRVRIEVEGGLYHLITRGVDRQDIFHDAQDYVKFLALVRRHDAARRRISDSKVMAKKVENVIKEYRSR